MVGVDRLQVGHFQKHLIAREHRKSRMRKIGVASLMLTSMVDMFSLLVIFLLQTFSSTPAVMNIQRGLMLPQATTGMATGDAPVLSLSKDEVILDQKPFGSLTGSIQNPQKLLDLLEEMKMTWMKQHPKESFQGNIHLQADRDLPAVQVAMMMNILMSQGYQTMHMTVVAAGKGP